MVGVNTTSVRPEQVDAFGGGAVAPCAGPGPSGPPRPSAGASVRIVDPAKSAWIGIELTDDEGHPHVGAEYGVTLPDGEALDGTLDESGRVRIEGIDPGTCQVRFPEYDVHSYERLAS